MDRHNIGQLVILDKIVMRDASSPENYPFYILVPQCPKNSSGKWLPWYSQRDDAKCDPIDAVDRLIDAVISQESVDPDRVTALGISAGGTALWEYGQRYPERFAAIVPLASSPQRIENPQALSSVSVWTFHSRGDRPQPVREAVVAVRESGGLTEVPGQRHACWHVAFNQYDLLPWMLSQSRNGADDGSFFTRSMGWQLFKHNYLSARAWRARWSNFWPIAIPIVAGAGLLWGTLRHFGFSLRRGRRTS